MVLCQWALPERKCVLHAGTHLMINSYTNNYNKQKPYDCTSLTLPHGFYHYKDCFYDIHMGFYLYEQKLENDQRIKSGPMS